MSFKKEILKVYENLFHKLWTEELSKKESKRIKKELKLLSGVLNTLTGETKTTKKLRKNLELTRDTARGLYINMLKNNLNDDYSDELVGKVFDKNFIEIAKRLYLKTNK